MTIVQLLLLLFFTEIGKSEVIKERSNDISDYYDSDNSDNEDNFGLKSSINCNFYDDDKTCKNFYSNKLDLLKNLFKRVPNHGARLLPSFQNMEHEEQFVPLYHTTTSLTYCGCNLTVKMRDLGLGFYPRFLKDGKCNPRSCKDGFSCREKHYKVRVLKHRSTPFPTAADIQSSDSALPEGLKDYWKAASVPITVACECL